MPTVMQNPTSLAAYLYARWTYYQNDHSKWSKKVVAKGT